MCHLLVVKVGKDGCVEEYTSYVNSAAGVMAAKDDARSWLDQGGLSAYVFKPGQYAHTMLVCYEERSLV